MRRDDVLEIEARIVPETDVRQQIYMTWKAFRHGPKEVIDRLNRGDAVDPETYYFRATPYFETSSQKYKLAEPHLLDSHRLPEGQWSDVRGFPGFVAQYLPTTNGASRSGC
jgi:hypothetical protein